MSNKSNARFLGHIISELQIMSPDQIGQPPLQPPTPDTQEADAPEPDPEELPDQDWAAQKTEYEL